MLTLVAGRVCGIGPNLSVDLDQALRNNGSNLAASQGILKPVAEEDGEGEGFTELVGTRRGTGGLYKAKSRF